MQREAQLTAQALQAQILSALAELRAGDASGLTAILATLTYLTGRAVARPGDVREAFTASRAGGPSDGLPIYAGPIASNDDGAAVRLIGAGVIAQRGYTAVEPGRAYAPRFVFRRSSDVSDPNGDAVRSAILWFDQNKNPLAGDAAASIVKDSLGLLVSRGRQSPSTVFARSNGPGVLLVAPSGARYARGMVQVFGQDGATDINVIDIDDVTNATILDPVSADVAARVGQIESQSLGTRTAALEAQAGTPKSLTFSTRGEAASASIPASVNTLVVLGLNASGDGGGDTYRRALAGETTATGSSVLGFRTSDNAAWLRTVRGPVDFISPLSYPGKIVPAPGGLDWKQAIEAALADGVAQGRPTLLDRNFTVSSVTLPRGACIVSSGGVLTGIATAATDCILNVPAGDVDITGRLKIWGGYSLNYEQGVRVSGMQTQFAFLDKLAVGACQIALTLGSFAFPFGILSEITIDRFQTYGCPGAIRVIGTETYISFQGCQVSADLFGAPASWSSLEVYGIKCIGAFVKYLGGELLCTNLPYGKLIKIYPLDSTRPTIEGTRYGQVLVIGTTIESAAALAMIDNPSFLTINSPSGTRGRLAVFQCDGYSGTDNTLIYVAPDYQGTVEIDSAELTFPGNRTQPIVFCAGGGVATHLYLPSKGIGPGFQSVFAGTVGGILHFEAQRIARAVGISQSIPANTKTVLKFSNRDYAGAGARYANSYDPATGYFTVPVGGLASVVLDAMALFSSAAVTGVIEAVDDSGNVLWAGAAVARGRGAIQAALGELPAGSKFAVAVTLDMAATVSGQLNQICIAASR